MGRSWSGVRAFAAAAIAKVKAPHGDTGGPRPSSRADAAPPAASRSGAFDARGWARACTEYARVLDPPRARDRARRHLRELRVPTAGALLVALVAVPLATAQSGGAGDGPTATGAATGDPLLEGRRNPSVGSATRETELIANFGASQGGTGAGKGGYALRESNLSNSGGGAIHGCRATRGNIDTAGFNAAQRNTKPCLRANNLAGGADGGRAFEFAFAGPLGGLIEHATGGDQFAPFSTNATGVAAGLNADRVDGRQGSDLLGRTEQAADSARLEGKRLNDVVMWGRFRADGVLLAGSGATSGQRINAGNYRAIFGGRDVSACSFQVTANDVNDNLTTQAAVDVTDATRVFVSLRNAPTGVRTDGDYQLAVHC